MNISLVIPTIRSLSFLDVWGDILSSCNLVIVEDHQTQEITLPKRKYQSVSHYTWGDIRKDFGKDEWIFSRHNAGIRSYGFWKAYEQGADIIITLDDDCYPVDKDFLRQHQKNLTLSAPESWITTFPHPDFVFTRGIPYTIRDTYPVMISHGLWSNQIDLDGITQKKHPHIHVASYPPFLSFIPKGSYFPLCSMNLAFRREMTPLMYFPLMGKDPAGNLWGFDRFDDIWAGIFAKKIMDHLGYAVVNGSPFIEHRKASDPKVNITKEKTGLPINEKLWQWVDAVTLTKKTPAACYQELAQQIVFPKTPYFIKLREAMLIWTDLFV
jgi:reversibly glycosylated polypeptide / UDP-arabinopyranose mutase